MAQMETQGTNSDSYDAKQWDMDNIIFSAKDQGAKQYQEDSTTFFTSPDLSVLMGAVFDGHGGLNGQVASNTSTTLCKEWFEKTWKQFANWSQKEWEKQMKDLFAHLHEKVFQRFIALEKNRRKHNKLSVNNVHDEKGVVRKASGFPVHGGTTATIVTVLRTANKWHVITANVGDSDALLLARKPKRLKQDNDKCKHLSVDHSPDSASEFLRIKELPTDKYPTKLLFVYDKAHQCRKYECPLVFLDDGTKDPKFVKNPWGNNLRPTNVRYDPAVYAVSPYGVQHDITCIAMTRSLGDFYAHQFGLSFVPDVTFNDLEMVDHEYIITVGSDGIWDCWKWDDFSDYVNGIFSKNENRLDTTTKTVLKHTIQRAKACFGEGSFDDASLVLISLNPDRYPKNLKSDDNSNNDKTNDKTNTNSTNDSSDMFVDGQTAGPSDRMLVNANDNPNANANSNGNANHSGNSNNNTNNNGNSNNVGGNGK